MGKRVCRKPILTMVFLMGNMFFAKMKSMESSDSVAEEVTNLMICAMVGIGILTWGTGVSSEMKM